jgi:RNA polymerase sigma-70 factor (ECF subfamily)
MDSTMIGREARFAALYQARYAAIHAYAARRVGPHAADEIAAETFLVAWRRWDAIPGEPLPWLYGVAWNVVQRHWEQSARQRRAVAALDHERVPVAHVTEEDDDRPLRHAWTQLRPADREVLALVAWEELPVAAAARVLGCSAAVFSVRLHRARRRLERLLTASTEPRTATALTEV